MGRLIDADLLMEAYLHDKKSGAVSMVKLIEEAPTVDAVPTEEQIKEYCRKRCLVIVDSGLFNEMKARWSTDPVKHAKLMNPNPFGECSLCGYLIDIRQEYTYCPNCGAKMDVSDTNVGKMEAEE